MCTKTETRAAIDAARRATRGGVILEVPPNRGVETPARMYNYVPDALLMSRKTLDAIIHYGQHDVETSYHSPEPTFYGVRIIFDDTIPFTQVRGAKFLK